MLTLPFQSRFSDLSTGQRNLYLVVLALSTVTTGLIIAPVSAHRILFRHRRKSALVKMGDLASKAGLTVLAFAVTGVVLLVFDVVVGRTAATVVAAATFGFFAVVWLLVPFALRRAD